MKSKYLLPFFLVACSVAFAQPQSAYDSVDPFIGTGADGNTFPGATVPFGMIQWSPDTRADGWYHYADKSIRGFSLTHISGAGCPIYGDVPILPWRGAKDANADRYESLSAAFSHGQEEAHPGYYRVAFDNGIRAELTVTERAGIARFEYPSDGERMVLIKGRASATINDKHRENDTSSLEIRNQDTVVGTVHSGGFCGSPTHYVLYFVVKFQRPFSAHGQWSRPVPQGQTPPPEQVGAFVTFPHDTTSVAMKVGISFVSIRNAEENLAQEIPGWDFGAVRAAAKATWTKTLDLIRAQGGTPDQRTIFYTGLYHMLLSPNLFSDKNGDYIGFDGKVRRLSLDEQQFANFSDWDIYRNTIQLQALLFPKQTSQMMQSLVRDAEQSGWLPRWPYANQVSYVMGGDSSAILLSEAYAFGARAFDTESALHFALQGATKPKLGDQSFVERPWLEEYLAKGYVVLKPDWENAASNTMEYANADFADSRFAAALGDQADATLLLKHAQNWRNLFDNESGWIRPRLDDGSFLSGWDPDHLLPRHKGWDQSDQMGFEEGSTWQYTFMLPYNYAGLFSAMGGDEKVIQRLDKFFQKLSGWGQPNFTVTNEPDFCAPYAYLWTSNPWKTAQVIDRIRKETFTTKPDGLPGNDDLGATSGVYVWNAIGIYPEIPGIGGFTIGTPMFPRVTVALGNGKELKISRNGDGVYVHVVRVNRAPHASSWLELSELSKPRNNIEFDIQSEQDRSWATKGSESPPSFGMEKTNHAHTD